MSSEPIAIETDVLVIGSGAAGMYAAIEASRGGARVFLVDRSLIGRGGATVMAQMTVAAALGEEVPDAPRHHYDDTIAAGRGLCDEAPGAAVVRGGAGLHSRARCLGRRLGAQR
jgi:succinate dehydrogenase / fumarate reductase flavoprotein subunit